MDHDESFGKPSGTTSPVCRRIGRLLPFMGVWRTGIGHPGSRRHRGRLGPPVRPPVLSFFHAAADLLAQTGGTGQRAGMEVHPVCGLVFHFMERGHDPGALSG